MLYVFIFDRSDYMNDTEDNRMKFNNVKRLSLFKRLKCNHDFIFLSGEGRGRYYTRHYGCLKCGKEEKF